MKQDELTPEEQEAIFERWQKEGVSYSDLIKWGAEAQLAKCKSHSTHRKEERQAELREKIIDGLHWKEYRFIGQGNAIFEGILTQESEEQIVDQILTYYPDEEEIRKQIFEGIKSDLEPLMAEAIDISDWSFVQEYIRNLGGQTPKRNNED